MLRGPQGTVFGETSTGGAINVITKKPVILGEASGFGVGRATATYNYVKGVRVRLTSRFQRDGRDARASVQYLRHDGYGSVDRGSPGRQRALSSSMTPTMSATAPRSCGSRTTRSRALLEGQGFSADHRRRAPEGHHAITEPQAQRACERRTCRPTTRLNTKMIYLTLVAGAGRVRGRQVGDRLSVYEQERRRRTMTVSPAPSTSITSSNGGTRASTFTQEVSLTSSAGQQRVSPGRSAASTCARSALSGHPRDHQPVRGGADQSCPTASQASSSRPTARTSTPRWAGYGQATLPPDR